MKSQDIQLDCPVCDKPRAVITVIRAPDAPDLIDLLIVMGRNVARINRAFNWIAAMLAGFFVSMAARAIWAYFQGAY